MLGVIVNTIAIIVSASIGVVAKKAIPENVSKACMYAMGLVCIFMGIKGSLVGENILLILISLVLGTAIGTLLNLEKIIYDAGEWLKKKVTKPGSEESKNFVDAYVTGSVIMAIGAMVLIGGIEAGLKNDYHTYYLKAVMDSVTAITLGSTMGLGAVFSSITVFIFQTIIVLFAGSLQFIVENENMMNEILCIGNILIMALGTNLLGVTKLKITNMLPSIILAPLIYMIIEYIK